MPFRGLTKGPMPDITPPQIVAMAVGGIPIIAELLHAFGVYDISLEQQQALSNAVTWAGILGAALIGGDAVLRTGRNVRSGKVEAVMVEGGEGENLQVVQQALVPTTPVVTTPPPGSTYQKTGFEEPPPKG